MDDRNSDIHVSEARRYAFIDCFYGFKHLIYREIEYRDLRNKALYPQEVKSKEVKIFRSRQLILMPATKVTFCFNKK